MLCESSAKGMDMRQLYENTNLCRIRFFIKSVTELCKGTRASRLVIQWLTSPWWNKFFAFNISIFFSSSALLQKWILVTPVEILSHFTFLSHLLDKITITVIDININGWSKYQIWLKYKICLKIQKLTRMSNVDKNVNSWQKCQIWQKYQFDKDVKFDQNIKIDDNVKID